MTTMSEEQRGVHEAEQYMLGINSGVNRMSAHEQIQNLVLLASGIIQASHVDRPLSGKSNCILDELLQMSEALQATGNHEKLHAAYAEDGCSGMGSRPNNQNWNQRQQQQHLLCQGQQSHASQPANQDHSRKQQHEHSQANEHSNQHQQVHHQQAHHQQAQRHGQSQGHHHASETQKMFRESESDAATNSNSSASGSKHSNNSDEYDDTQWETLKNTDVKFDDIMGCSRAIEIIREAVVIPMQFPALFKKMNAKRSNGLILYGPPGTGKTMIARATASEVHACFFNASCAELTSRWVGGSEKKLKSLFKAALLSAPSIIFFDEIDSIASKREGDTSVADQRLTNQFLIELDNIYTSQAQVFVIAATNLPWQIDLAVMRRFPCSVYIPLPDKICRTKMFQAQLQNVVGDYTDIQYSLLSDCSQHMSGSDISNIINAVRFEPLRRLYQCKSFVSTRNTQNITTIAVCNADSKHHSPSAQLNSPPTATPACAKIAANQPTAESSDIFSGPESDDTLFPAAQASHQMKSSPIPIPTPVTCSGPNSATSMHSGNDKNYADDNLRTPILNATPHNSPHLDVQTLLAAELCGIHSTIQDNIVPDISVAAPFTQELCLPVVKSVDVSSSCTTPPYFLSLHEAVHRAHDEQKTLEEIQIQFTGGKDNSDCAQSDFSIATTDAEESNHQHHMNYNACDSSVHTCDTIILNMDLAQVIAVYGEDCIDIPCVEFECILKAVQNATATATADYVMNYEKYNNSRKS